MNLTLTNEEVIILYSALRDYSLKEAETPKGRTNSVIAEEILSRLELQP